MVTTFTAPLGCLRIDASLTPPRLLLLLRGEMDFCDDDTLTSTDTLDLSGVSRITMDLDGLDFVDAAGVRALRRFADVHRAGGYDVELTGARQSVRRVFQLLGDERYLTPAA